MKFGEIRDIEDLMWFKFEFEVKLLDGHNKSPLSTGVLMNHFFSSISSLKLLAFQLNSGSFRFTPALSGHDSYQSSEFFVTIMQVPK